MIVSTHLADILSNTRRGKIRGASLPQEYALENFVRNVTRYDHTWSSQTPACEWAHVVCGEMHVVKELSWGQLGLEGYPHWPSLPDTIGYMAVGRNKLAGELDFSKFPFGLLLLHAHKNQLYGNLHLHFLPSDLERLDLVKNRFDGDVDLTCLPKNLQYLDLGGNALSGLIDLTRFPEGILFVGLDKNTFIGTPELRFLPSTLQRLYLHENLFEGRIELESLPQTMRCLCLQDNSLLSGSIKRDHLPVGLRGYWFNREHTNVVVQ